MIFAGAVQVLVVVLLVVGASILAHEETLDLTRTFGLPSWVDALTRRPEVAYPSHAALGTALEVLGGEPSVVALQWFKAAAHARSEADVERAARGIAAALQRGPDDHRLVPTLCTLRDLGNPAQVRALAGSGLTCEGWRPSITIEAMADPPRLTAGAAVSIVAAVTSVADLTGLVDLEIHGPDGSKVAQWVFEDQELSGEHRRDYVVTWGTPAELPPGEYVIKAGVFQPGWKAVHGWSNAAGTITIVPIGL